MYRGLLRAYSKKLDSLNYVFRDILHCCHRKYGSTANSDDISRFTIFATKLCTYLMAVKNVFVRIHLSGFRVRGLNDLDT